MSDSTQQYVLKQRTFWKESDSIGFGYTADSLIISCPIDLREIFFQPLDISAMEKQLEQLLAPFIFMSSQEGYYELEDNELFEKLNSEDDTKVIVAEVLAVFGLENKETSDG